MKKLLFLSTILAGGLLSANAQFNRHSDPVKRNAIYRDNKFGQHGPFAEKNDRIIFSDNRNRGNFDDRFRDHDRYERRDRRWQYRDCDNNRRSRKRHDEYRDHDRW